MKLKIKLILFSFLSLGIVKAQESTSPDFPPFGIGIANGYTTGTLVGKKFDGYTGQFRLIKVFNTYPPFFLGLDASYSSLKFKDDFVFLDAEGESISLQDLKAEKTSLGISAGVMIPLDLFISSDKIPAGAGPPIIIGYNFLEEIKFDDFAEKIQGQGFKIGFQMPLPISQKIFFNLQAEYYKSFFKDTEELPSFLNAAELDSDGWNFSFQIGIPLGKKKSERD